MNEGTITKQQLADKILEVWLEAMKLDREGKLDSEEVHGIISACKTLADVFELTISNATLN